ncbi:TRAP transporter large permease [Vibrio nitrifigilis]|uniref:TRAP transporter large permease protein n=1 Tax=Vibrio nitrifigilis TaxID=2789781 RepID=A0ABS0GL97_9VIBR|nr:TRAP transporter large permease [Vibrio nitrifigilis]MBF9003095.1 TRAP transporter large permease [Vibrio nitrifigilis]
MDFTIIGTIAILGLLFFLFIGLPLALSFVVTSFIGILVLLNVHGAMSLLGETAYSAIASPTFTVLPLFVLMGAFAATAGFAEQAYKGISKLTGSLPGSLAVATAFGSAAFSTVCGSSLATASVFGRIAYPEMIRYGYEKKFSLGSIACSGSLAAMIPPSGMFILFSLFTDVPVGKLFMAGVLPGLLTALAYVVVIYWKAKRHPEIAPIPDKEKHMKRRDRMTGLLDLWQLILLGGAVLGGMYSGLFTATEAGAIGALGALLMGLIKGPLRSLKTMRSSLRESAGITTTLFFIIIGALFFSRFLGLTRIPFYISHYLVSSGLPGWSIMAMVLVIWFLMGMIIVPAAAFALTLPIIFPIITQLGYDPIWFCIIAMKMCEIAGVTPPVGLNAFALNSAAGKDVKVNEVFVGVWPFVACDLVVLAILLSFPIISTWLPNTMFG